MKQRLFLMLAISAMLMTALDGCKKKDKNPCGGDNSQYYGGIGPSQTYYYRVFYKKVDFGGGAMTIEVRDGNGAIVNPASPKLTTYIPAGIADCSATAGTVKVELKTGQSYTWRAYDASQIFNGNIDVSCTPGSCAVIEIKK